ncbi:GPI transamidase component GPI16 [Coprinopsis cinerea okayama7|uniref:GPI transamidase component GPI16 n=1 Tax=Coprinopsis cinerea (strain Okayama-7 / 130 / ATCC MYA-4618 / FGSC 9003) TaxID=240176 RepID=A8PEZ3_COPC7|nr:GPI transamidase component GPI16 [Coprinopsis cinerea okayama7\|eukprot:XP_001840882.2 GPI transamidase component GPI16 [Coprinopsis cinerea okayama7\
MPRDPAKLHEDDASQHYTLFPLGLGQILREYGVAELHLSLNAGKWNYDKWGYPLEQDVGTGAELWAWMGDGAVTSVDDRWKSLRNALAGLFCSSLGRLDELRTTSPAETFKPEGSLPHTATHQLRHASLPSENVCTENLTPFLKLLPCKGLSGIASLLNPHRLFDANWHGLGVHVLWHQDEGVEVRLTFQTVSDPLRSPLVTKQDWSLESLFNRKIERACPVARSSEISVVLPTNDEYSIYPEPSSIRDSVALYETQSVEKPLNIAMEWAINFDHLAAARNQKPQTSLSVQRTLKERSQLNGQLSVSLTNHDETTLEVLYLETMPWIVQFYLHTLVPRVNGVVQNEAVSNISYIPAIPHSRPTTFQAVLTIPPKSTLLLTMDVTKAFLRYTEHPPDAQRGWDLPPAIILPLNDNDSNDNLHQARIYTPTLLVDLATPDFSMPYNVIIFTCSLMSFIFGSIFNLLTRKFVVVALDPPKSN